MSKARPVSMADGFGSVTFKPDRTPESKDMASAFHRLAPYRDGAVFLAHWAGSSQWEVHRSGDEIVMVVEGATTLTLLMDGEQQSHAMETGELIVVPAGVWHRFDTPHEVKLMTVTPQPTEHSVSVPQ